MPRSTAAKDNREESEVTAASVRSTGTPRNQTAGSPSPRPGRSARARAVSTVTKLGLSISNRSEAPRESGAAHTRATAPPRTASTPTARIRLIAGVYGGRGLRSRAPVPRSLRAGDRQGPSDLRAAALARGAPLWALFRRPRRARQGARRPGHRRRRLPARYAPP